nr:hypothetical protein [Tanacetum cinerariifolium]
MSSDGTSFAVTYTSISSKARSRSILNKDPFEEAARQYLASPDDEIPMEDQPLPADTSLIALSPGYIVDSGLEEDKEDPVDYSTDGGDDDDESFDDGDDDDNDVKEDEEEEEENLASAESAAIASPAVDRVPFADETEPFETDESAATPPPPPPTYLRLSPSLLPPMSSSLPPSFQPSPIRPSHTRAVMAQMRATAPSTHHSLHPLGTPPLLVIPLPAPSTSRRADIPEADMSHQKRLLLTAPTPRFKVGESSAATAR